MTSDVGENLSRGFCLGDFEIIPDRNIVIHNNQSITLEPKIMDVCCLLAKQCGNVVSRDELIDQVWKVKFGSDESLTRAIYILRKAFNQPASGGVIIETIPKRGYRLVALIAGPTIEPQHHIMSSSRDTKPSIAVLAFTDMSEDGDQGYFSDGIAEEIINALVPIPGLVVCGRTSSFSFKGHQASIREIADKLDVTYILEGSVRKHADQIRITAQLIDAIQDNHIWSETYNGTVDQVFDLQDNIAHSVCKELELLLHVEDYKPRLASTLTDDHQAYDLFLQGRALSTRIFGDGVLEQAVEFLLEAVAIDADFAEAWAELANAYAQTAAYVEIDDHIAVLRKSLPAAQKAIDLKPGYAYPKSVQSLNSVVDCEIVEALRLADESCHYEPDNPDIIMHYGFLLAGIGRTKDALPWLEKSVKLDPKQGRNHMILSMAKLNNGDIEGAEYHAQKAVDLNYHVAYLSHAVAAYGADNCSLAIERMMAGINASMHKIISPEFSTPEIWEKIASSIFGGTSGQRELLVKGLNLLISKPDQKVEISFTYILLLAGAAPAFFDAYGSNPSAGNHLVLVNLWGPLAPANQVREHPDFQDFAARTGLTDAWKIFGNPDCWVNTNAGQ